MTLNPNVTEERVREMLAAAEKATPGPWSVRMYSGTSTLRMVTDPGRKGMCIEAVPGDTADFIANCDPQAIYSILTELLAARRTIEEMTGALKPLQSFVAVMIGRGPDATIPETIGTPLGIPVKIGDIMRNVEAALSKSGEQVK